MHLPLAFGPRPGVQVLSVTGVSLPVRRSAMPGLMVDLALQVREISMRQQTLVGISSVDTYLLYQSIEATLHNVDQKAPSSLQLIGR